MDPAMISFSGVWFEYKSDSPLVPPLSAQPIPANLTMDDATLDAVEHDEATSLSLSTPPSVQHQPLPLPTEELAERDDLNTPLLPAGLGTKFQSRERETMPLGFDEGILKSLGELDCGMPLLFDRIKQGLASCREASTFLKKRAQIEEDYARAITKLSRSSLENYSASDGKAGSFLKSYQTLLRSHERIGTNRLTFAAQLNTMSDELLAVGKEVEKTRKLAREVGMRGEKGLLDCEALVDKAKVRFDSAAEELERLLLLKSGEPPRDLLFSGPPSTSSSSLSNANMLTNQKGGGTFGKAMSKLKGPRSVAQIQRMEEESRTRMGQANDSYRAQVLGAREVRSEWFGKNLPWILRSLKESTDELDLGTQYHLTRYAYLFENVVLSDGLVISPLPETESVGLRGVLEAIDTREDFKTFLQQYALNWQMSGQRGPRRDGPIEEGYPNPTNLNSSNAYRRRPSSSPRTSMSSTFSNNQLQQPLQQPSYSAVQLPPPSPQKATFGIDLAYQLQRDNLEIPRVLEKCCVLIEAHGLEQMGIYRLSGTTSRVQRLKASLDRDVEAVDLFSEENMSDINDIAAVMKLWIRELPEPLLTWDLYAGFIEAAKIENDRLRHIRLHERVNDLPDANYATLKFLMGHLDKVRSFEHLNQMSCSNLAIVFGPNLLGAPPNPNNDGSGTALADMAWQCKCVETILVNYEAIFVDTTEIQ